MSALSNSRNMRGITIIEMLVSVLIIGIATAGLSTLLGLDIAYILRISNKSDNMLNAQYAIDRLNRELRMAARVDSNSTGTLLVFYVPEFDTNAQISGGTYGFPQAYTDATSGELSTNMDQYIYQVQQVTTAQKDTGQGMPSQQWMVTRYVTRGNPSISVTNAQAMSQVNAQAMPVVKGLVGPLTGASGQPKVFEYVQQSDASQTVLSTPQGGTVGAVVMNVEMMRANQAQASGSVDQLTFRSEVSLRNANWMMP